MTVSEEKTALRGIIKTRIDGLSGEYIKHSDKGICEKLLSLPEFSGAKRVLFYYGVGREPSTAAAIKTALELGKTVALPVTFPHGKMSFRAVSDTDGLALGKFDIPEPDDDCPEIKPQAGDVIIVPGLCFDKRLFRLGHGGGYYDRFLAGFRLCSVGLCREALLQEHLPADKYDFPVDVLITEAEILRK